MIKRTYLDGLLASRVLPTWRTLTRQRPETQTLGEAVSQSSTRSARLSKTKGRTPGGEPPTLVLRVGQPRRKPPDSHCSGARSLSKYLLRIHHNSSFSRKSLVWAASAMFLPASVSQELDFETLARRLVTACNHFISFVRSAVAAPSLLCAVPSQLLNYNTYL